MIVTDDFIPKLSSRISVVPFDDKNYLICVDGANEIKLTISKYTKTLLELIDGSKSVKELTSDFNQKNRSNYTIDQITEIFNKQLLGYGIFEEDGNSKILIKDNYLRLRFTLIPDKLVKTISGLFTFLFSKIVFVTISLLCLASLGYIFYAQINIKEFYENITPNFFFYFYVLNVLGILFHEFGHAAACLRFGANSGAIGFGFYLFTPVFYADVTDAWRLNRSERLIVDMGGVYMQLMYCIILVGLSSILHDKTYLYIAFSITTTMIININPFLRFDGYWALSDLLNIPNLKAKSNETLLLLSKSIFSKNENKFKMTSRNLLLLIYGAISLIFVVVFFGYMVLYKHDSVIYFPYNIFLFFRTLVLSIPNIEFSWIRDSLAGFILPLMFYIVTARYLWNRRLKFLDMLKRK